jgi:hypothetical protein
VFRTKSRHVCLAARPNSTIEHLQVIARQSIAEGLKPCWLDLGHEEGIRELAADYDGFGAKTVPVHTEAALRRHFKRHRPVAIWVQTPYAEHYPDWFWSTAEEWPLSFAQYSITMMTWHYGLYQMPTIRQFKWILVENQTHGNGYLANGIPAERVILAGNPALYELRQRPASELEITNDLLWASHWSQDWFGERGFSRWREVAPVVLEWARAHPERQIVVRPHPLLHDRAVASADTDDAGVRAYLDLFELPNVTLSDRSLVDDVAHSGALLSDGLSILAYFASTGKPLGMIHDDETPDYNDLGNAILGTSDELSTPAEIADWLDRLPELAPNEKRRRMMDRLLPAFPESPIAIWNRRRLGADAETTPTA